MIDTLHSPIGLHPRLRGHLSSMARGRVLVIGYFTSRCCGGTFVGDLTVDWRSAPGGAGLCELALLDGVPVLADERVVEVLLADRAVLAPGSIVRRGTPTLRLANPDAWMAFLERRPMSSARAPRS